MILVRFTCSGGLGDISADGADDADDTFGRAWQGLEFVFSVISQISGSSSGCFSSSKEERMLRFLLATVIFIILMLPRPTREGAILSPHSRKAGIIRFNRPDRA